MAAVIIFCYLIGGIFYRQIVQYKFFQQKETQQNLRRIILPGTRGNIYDRNGILLAGHRKLFSLNLHLDELQSEFQREYLRNVNDLNERGVSFNPEELRRSVRENIVQKYLSTVNAAIGSSYEISGKEIEKHLNQKFLLPMVLADDISQEDYEKLIYILPRNSPLQLAVDEVRHYPHDSLACHVIGYTVLDENSHDTQIFPEKVRTFAIKRQVGKAGIELAKDDILHGVPGYKLWQVDTMGRNRELLKSEEPKHGSSVMLSIDKNLQSAAEHAIEDNRGCAIVMSVRTGEILAMANKPSYNINLLTPKIFHSVYDEITAQQGWANLAMQGKFPLGSVFKLVSAMAFLKSGEVLQTDSVFCSGVTEIGERKFHCRNHQAGMTITFGEAIARSCNTFFYENAKKVKKNRIILEAVNLGFAEKTGIELPYEGAGFVPTEEWKKSRGFGNWVLGDTINLSIGQGYLLATPLEVCCFTASIATNRLRTKPTIFFNGNKGLLPNEPNLGLSDSDYNFLVTSMFEVVDAKTGTGRRAKLDGLKIAGKTGTAQFFEHGQKRNLAWFTCFAPADDPEIAVTVVVQEKNTNDSFWGGKNAAPIAKKILAEYFH
jgi:penicillin-binding protein 2